MIFTTDYESPVGRICLAQKDQALVGLWLEGQRHFLGAFKKEEMRKENTLIFQQVKLWLDRYFSRENPSIEGIPMAPEGSSFRKKVWKILCEIPYGTTMTYGQIAKKLAGAGETLSVSPRAVGGAVGHNPISIIIPCHRVVGANGNLTGYAGGIEKKIALLSMEGADISKMFVPN